MDLIERYKTPPQKQIMLNSNFQNGNIDTGFLNNFDYKKES